MLQITVKREGSQVTVVANSLKDLCDQIVELKSVDLALELYTTQYNSLNDEQKEALENIIGEDNSFNSLYNIFKRAPQLAPKIEDKLIAAFFSANASIACRPCDYKDDGYWCHFASVGSYNTLEEMFIAFYESTKGLCDPNKAIQYCIINEIYDQEIILMKLAKLPGADKERVKEFFLKNKNFPAIIIYSHGVEAVPEEVIFDLAMEVTANEECENLRNAFFLNAVESVDDVKLIEQLVDTFASSSKSALYASWLAGAVSDKINLKLPEGKEKMILYSLLFELEEMVVKYCEDDACPLLIYLRDVSKPNKTKIFNEIVKIYRRGIFGNSISREQHDRNRGYLKEAKIYVPYKIRLACKLGLITE
jgi:hypothetical protein